MKEYEISYTEDLSKGRKFGGFSAPPACITVPPHLRRRAAGAQGAPAKSVELQHALYQWLWPARDFIAALPLRQRSSQGSQGPSYRVGPIFTSLATSLRKLIQSEEGAQDQLFFVFFFVLRLQRLNRDTVCEEYLGNLRGVGHILGAKPPILPYISPRSPRNFLGPWPLP